MLLGDLARTVPPFERNGEFHVTNRIRDEILFFATVYLAHTRQSQKDFIPSAGVHRASFQGSAMFCL
jgi:hypothetical protein